jgi:hypothetical protein
VPNYLVTITGHINEEVRPEGFPREIRQVEVISAVNNAKLGEAVNDLTILHLRNRGMAVRKDPYAKIDPYTLDLNRMWVPMDMISHMDVDVQMIQELNNIDETGTIVVPKES